MTRNRRQFLASSTFGLGTIALSSLLGNGAPHFLPRAKRVIFLGMIGGVPQLDLVDYKPKLRELDGQSLPSSLNSDERFANIKPDAKVFASPYRFNQYGHSGVWISSLLPHFAKIVDEVCLIQALRNDEINHPSAQLLLLSGFPRSGRPSMGSWITYGLGSECDNLPSYIVLTSGEGPESGVDSYSSGFLPGEYRGVEFHGTGNSIHYLRNPDGLSRQVRRDSLNVLARLNEREFNRVGAPEIRTRIAQYEMAFQMQRSVPELMDLSREPAYVHSMYGTTPGKSSFANNCLLARRMVERGVRFVQLHHGSWDLHSELTEKLPKLCRETDQGAAALVKDLKQRGLLEETLVIWATEFGRTPMREGADGRDHHKTFSIWMAGGGVKAGYIYGATDELGYKAVEKEMHVHDLQATILSLVGLDHTRLTYKFQGRDFRLTDVAGRVVQDLVA